MPLSESEELEMLRLRKRKATAGEGVSAAPGKPSGAKPSDIPSTDVARYGTDQKQLPKPGDPRFAEAGPSVPERMIVAMPGGAAGAGAAGLAARGLSAVPKWTGALREAPALVKGFERFVRPIAESLKPKTARDLAGLAAGGAAAGAGGEGAREQARRAGAGPTGQYAAELAGSMAAPFALHMPPVRAAAELPGELAGPRLARETERLGAEREANVLKDTARAKAQQAGFTTPPEAGAANWLTGIAGEQRMSRWLSGKNQPEFQKMLAEHFGLDVKKGKRLGPEDIEKVRDDAYKVYKEVSGTDYGARSIASTKASPILDASGKPIQTTTTRQVPGMQPTPGYQAGLKSQIDDLSAKIDRDPKTYGYLKESLSTLRSWAKKEVMKPHDVLEDIKSLRFQATKNFRSENPQKVALAFTQKEIASNLETLLEENATRAGKPDLADRLRGARTRIAQSYDVEAALNPETGEISAKKLAALSEKRPLSGALEQIADFYRAYPEAAQKVKPETRISILDFMYEGMSVAKHPLRALSLAGARIGIPMAAEKGLLQHKPMYAPGERFTLPADLAGAAGITPEQWAAIQAGQLIAPPADLGKRMKRFPY